MAATLAYYKDRLGFDCVGTWDDPPVYAIVVRDGHRIHFRLVDSLEPSADKYADELLDAYLLIDSADEKLDTSRSIFSWACALAAAP